MYGNSGLAPFSNIQDIQAEGISGTNASEKDISKDNPPQKVGHPSRKDRPVESKNPSGIWVAERPDHIPSNRSAQSNRIKGPNDALDALDTDSLNTYVPNVPNDAGDLSGKRKAIPQTAQSLSLENEGLDDHDDHIYFPHGAVETPLETADTLLPTETVSKTAPIDKTPEKVTLRKQILEKQILVRPGDTLLMILTAAGVREEDANEAVVALGDMFDPKHMKPGYSVDLTLEAYRNPKTGLISENNTDLHLQTATIQIEPLRSIVIEREGISFLASVSEQEVRREERRLSGTIFNSLSQAAHREKVPATVIEEMIDAYSYDVDFQRDIRREDRFEVMYEENFIGDRPVPGTAKLIHASLELSGQKSELYRFRPAQGEDGFYNEQGQGVRKALLRTPVNGARLSSRYGMRKHPILGYNRMHRGVDFAAPKGTPIYAAGNGIIRKAQRNGNYGHYVEIKHNEQFSTAYAHLSRYAKGIKAGAHVRQGQIIGYVGSSGLSSGPHLHFEVRRNNKSINPLSMRLPSVEKLSNDDLRIFKQRVADIQQRYANLEEKTAVVSRE